MIDFSLLDQEAGPAPFNNEVAYLRQNARQFIERVDRQENLQTQQVVPLFFGTWNATYVLQPQNLVLKLSPWDSQFEADFLQIASRKGLKVPAFLGCGTVGDGVLPTASYTLMEYIPNTAVAGQLLADGLLPEPQLLAIGKEMGCLLAQLHTERVGHIYSFGKVNDNWGDCLGLWQLKPVGIFDTALLSRLEQILQQTKYREYQEGVQIHSDANLHNVLVDKETHQFKVLIDPGPQSFGMAMYDLAYATWPWWYGLNYMEAVVEAYRQESRQYDELLFYTSLLCVAYLMSPYGHVTELHKEVVVNHILGKVEYMLGDN